MQSKWKLKIESYIQWTHTVDCAAQRVRDVACLTTLCSPCTRTSRSTSVAKYSTECHLSQVFTTGLSCYTVKVYASEVCYASHRSSISFQVSQRFLFPHTSIILFILREYNIVCPLHVNVAPLNTIQVCVCVCACVKAGMKVQFHP